MAFIPVPNVVRVAINFTSDLGNDAVNVIHISNGVTAVTPAVLADMANVVEGWLATNWAFVASVHWTGTLLELRDLTVQDSIGLDRETAEAGTVAGEAMPSQVTAAISLRTNFLGRSRRGRLYHVGLAETMVSGDFLSGVVPTALIDCYEALRTLLTAAGYTWVVVSYQTNGAPRTTGLATEITSIILTDTIVDSQDRRKPRP